MNEQSLKPVIEQLEKLFSTFNSKFFNDELQKPVITVSPDTTKGAYGWCTAWRSWSNHEPKDFVNMTPEEVEAAKNEGFYEINLCAEHLARPFNEICETLIHEMVHLLNIQNGVQDTSRSGSYHNKKYKEIAEQHGLIAEKTPKYGYSKTTLNEAAKIFVESLQEKKYELYRRKEFKGVGSKKSSSSSRKYVCPMCGCIIRATKEVHVICGDCEVEFEEEK